MTTEQKIEVLEKDILQRTGRYFTSVRTNGRLGQEDASASGAVYSAAMVRWGLFFSRATFFFSGRVIFLVTGKGTDSPFSPSPLCPFSTQNYRQ